MTAKKIDSPPQRMHSSSVYLILLAIILVVAGVLRLTGIDWGRDQLLHPDERFLAQLESSLLPVDTLGQYFDTANSTLNPANRGHAFYVYGTLPLFMVRYVAEWVDQVGAYDVQVVGRYFSAMADLLLILITYLIAVRLFDRRVGLLAAAFSAFAVMQIQQSHYFTVDNFTNLFAYLALYFAVRIATERFELAESEKPGSRMPFALWDMVWFGLAFGMAVASKVSIVPLAAVLPLAVAINLMRVPPEDRELYYGRSFLYMVLAALVSLVAFRVFQPYAFEGPGFFGISLNPQWVDALRQLQGQVSGDVDWPPSMQWARRTVWYGLENMVRWGLGWPLAIVACAGFLWAGWRLLRGDWRKPFVIIWAWAAFYFVWQSLAFNPTMRYFLPVYPALALFAAWVLFRMWDAGWIAMDDGSRWRFWARPLALLLGSAALVGSAVWAMAFINIYREEPTRVQATRWIFENLPGPLNLHTFGEKGETLQPMPFTYGQVITADQPYFTSVRADNGGRIERLSLHHIVTPVIARFVTAGVEEDITLTLSEVLDFDSLVVGDAGQMSIALPAYVFTQPLQEYSLSISLPAGEGTLSLESVHLNSAARPELPAQTLIAEDVRLPMGESFTASFNLAERFIGDGNLPDRLVVSYLVQSALSLAPVNLHLTVSRPPDMGQVLSEFDLTAQPSTQTGGSTEGASFEIGRLIRAEQDEMLYLQIDIESPGQVTLLGSAVANESSWDDGLPLRLYPYDPFGGIYQGDLNFEMYWDEDATKLARFVDTLDRAEYIFISSSRQWGSLPRIPERFPLVIEYYRHLLGCPAGDSIELCFNEAALGTYQGNLGFELVQVFDASPQINGLVFNDQPADEAFTVYDHPKVFIFQKAANYDQQHVVDILSAVDLTQVQRLTPKQASGDIPPNLMLPSDRLEEQRAGGTWSQIFDTENWINANPWISALIWYLALAALGLAVYPLVRMALPGLADGGYAFARIAGLLLLAWLAWLGASLGLSFSRVWLAIFALLLAALGGLAARPQLEQMKAEWKTKRHRFIRIELIFLAFFVIMLLIRLGNPDLWHPGKGGEKPMDFAYFNAVLRSTSFPPYDPWFAGGYINYYYYGFVLVGSLTKLLGVLPSVAYNLILPSLFAMLAVGVYSIGWNLWKAWQVRQVEESPIRAHWVGLTAAVGAVLLGNLGSLQMIFQGWQRLGAEGAFSIDAAWFTRLGWALQGFIMSLSGQPLPFGVGDFYWNPTRLHPDVPIAEFPLFTFTYADLHAHMIALPVTLLALAWALSALLSRAWENNRCWWQLGWSFLLGGIAIGSLRPTNTWDFPTYLALGVLASGLAIWLYGPRVKNADGAQSPPLGWSLLAPIALVAISVLAYQPFADWYRQGYTSLQLWQGGTTPSGVYLVHWGLFLFIMAAWMAWETRQWLAETPLSSLRKLEPYRFLILGAALITVAVLFGLLSYGVHVAWLALPLMIWAGLLMLRPGQDETKRVVLFLIGTGLFITLFVEIVVLAGDIGRQNTLFKFYLQVWLLFALGSGLALAWTLDEFPLWSVPWKRVWQGVTAVLLASTALFLMVGVSAKIRDRMAVEAPHTLDGNAYMPYALYYDQGQELHLEEDYAAIRWLQENVEGSPALVEAHTGEYRWGARISINTGLPAVIGWNWHQRQQREFVPGNDIWGRVGEVTAFYETTDRSLAEVFLQNYQVRFIVLGELERAYYPGAGLLKFEDYDGLLWDEVFRVDDTVIYQVRDSTLALP